MKPRIYRVFKPLPFITYKDGSPVLIPWWRVSNGVPTRDFGSWEAAIKYATTYPGFQELWRMPMDTSQADISHQNIQGGLGHD